MEALKPKSNSQIATEWGADGAALDAATTSRTDMEAVVEPVSSSGFESFGSGVPVALRENMPHPKSMAAQREVFKQLATEHTTKRRAPKRGAKLASSGDVRIDGFNLLAFHDWKEHLDALPRFPKSDALSDASVIARCSVAARKDATAIRDFVNDFHYDGADLRGGEVLERIIIEHLRKSIQDWRLPLEIVRASFVAGWRFVPVDQFGHLRRVPIPPLPPKFNLEATIARLANDAQEWLYEGSSADKISALVAAERTREIEMSESAAKESVRRKSTKRTTPRDASLFVIRRPADSPKGERIALLGPSRSIFRDGWEWCVFCRVWPGDVHSTPFLDRGATSTPIGWQLVQDDELVELETWILEEGRQWTAPRTLFDALFASARARLVNPQPILTFVTRKDRKESTRRLALFEAFLDGPVSTVFQPNTYIEAAYRAIIMHWGIEALRLAPNLVADAIAKRSPTNCGWGRDIAGLVTDGCRLALAPTIHLFAVDSGVVAAEKDEVT